MFGQNSTALQSNSSSFHRIFTVDSHVRVVCVVRIVCITFERL